MITTNHNSIQKILEHLNFEVRHRVLTGDFVLREIKSNNKNDNNTEEIWEIDIDGLIFNLHIPYGKSIIEAPFINKPKINYLEFYCFTKESKNNVLNKSWTDNESIKLLDTYEFSKVLEGKKEELKMDELERERSILDQKLKDVENRILKMKNK